MGWRYNGSFFFENAPGQIITGSGARYRDMIIQVVVPKFPGMDEDGICLQQDGIKCNGDRELLNYCMSHSVISCFSDQNWPLRSCDLTLLDFFFSCLTSKA